MGGEDSSTAAESAGAFGPSSKFLAGIHHAGDGGVEVCANSFNWCRTTAHSGAAASA